MTDGRWPFTQKATAEVSAAADESDAHTYGSCLLSQKILFYQAKAPYGDTAAKPLLPGSCAQAGQHSPTWLWAVCPIAPLPPRGNEDRGANHYVGATWSSWLHMGLQTQEGNGMENTNQPSSTESER